MPIKNYTTEVSEERTVGEIMGLLAAKGARSVQLNYDDQQRVQGISFVVMYEGLPIPFKLPCNFTGVLKSMAGEYRSTHARHRFETDPNSTSQARRVAWRIVKDWVAAQMAIIEAEQASLIQVFLPYVVQDRSGATMYERFIKHIDRTKALPEAASTEAGYGNTR